MDRGQCAVNPCDTRPAKAMAASPIRTLSVQSHLIFRVGLSATIESPPDMPPVAQATPATKGISRFRKHQPNVTPLELHLVGTASPDGLKGIRGGFSDARIGVLTASNCVGQIQRGLRAGASAYIPMRGSKVEELRAIRSVHVRGRCVHPEMAARIAERLGEESLTAREFDVARFIRDGYGILFDEGTPKTKSALQMQKDALLGIIETIPPMLWSASPAGEVTHISPRVREYSGLVLEDFLNFGWKRFIHPDDFEDTAKAFVHSIQTGETISAIHRLRRSDGEYRWHHAMGEPLRDSGGNIVQWYGLSVDIDERKRTEDYLRDMRVKLTRASRIAMVAELSASIAHELNQPLTSIVANAQAAKRWLSAAPPNMPEVNTSIERVLRDARAANESMQHIRALFKQEPFETREANIADIIREAIRFVHEDPKKRQVPIDLCLDDSLPAVSVDAIQIQQLFINLLSNAIEALEGSPVHPLVRVAASKTDRSELIVQVIDNGPGVVDTENIFDAFVTTKDKGMGIGLAVSRSIAEAHRGRLWAENGTDGGARFNVALPLPPAYRDPGKV
jgi:PAS domain S-box-containing protein